MNLRFVSRRGRAACGVSATQPGLQQPLHPAGVLLYVHGGSVGGAGQSIQSLILPLQLCLGLQGEVLELHQHLWKGNKLTFILRERKKNVHTIFTRAAKL